MHRLVLSLGPRLHPLLDVWLRVHLIIKFLQLGIVSHVYTHIVFEVVQQLMSLNVCPGEFLTETNDIQVIDILLMIIKIPVISFKSST